MATAVLRRLCLGTAVEDVQSEGHPQQLLLADSDAAAPVFRRLVRLTLETRWQVFPKPPAAFPRLEDEFPELSEEEQLRELSGLRGAKVVAVHLESEAPHLALTFEDGRILFVNGWHPSFECWQLGSASIGIVEGGGLVVACPGADVAIWTPLDSMP